MYPKTHLPASSDPKNTHVQMVYLEDYICGYSLED